MLEIYKGKGIKEEDLPHKLLNDDWWYRYQKKFKVKERSHSPLNKQMSMIRSFFINNCNIKLGKRDIYRMMKHKVFKKNVDHHEEVKEKIDYLSSKLRLSIEEQELQRLLGLSPELLTNSFDELKQKVEYFNETLQCSFDESKKRDELKDFFLTRKVIVTQSIQVINDYQHEILSKGYELSIEKLRKLLLYKKYSPSDLPAMMEDLEERKMILRYLFSSSKTFNRDSFNNILVTFPELLWISPERFYDAIYAVIEGGLASSVNDTNIQKIFKIMPALLILQKHTITEKIRLVFPLLTQSNNSNRQITAAKDEDYSERKLRIKLRLS